MMLEFLAVAGMAFWTLLAIQTRARRPVLVRARCVSGCGEASRTEI